MCRLTEEMLENVIYENWQEVDNYKSKNLSINLHILKDACHDVRQMYYDSLEKFVGTIQKEDFFYSIPLTDRKQIIKIMKNVTCNAFTYDAILDNSISSLEYLMLLQYEIAIDAEDCDSLIFNINVK